MSALDDIRQRAEAATEGPWRLWHDRSPHDSDNKRGAAVESAWAYDADGEDTELITDWCRTADAEFIAHARTDIPSLLDAVDEVLNLHPQGAGNWTDWDGIHWTGEHCIYCKDEWPCSTVAAVNDALEAGK